MWVPVPSQDLEFQHYLPKSPFVFIRWNWEVIVRFINIGGIVYHHCLKFLFIVVGGLRMYKMKHIILFYSKTFNPDCSCKGRYCWRTEPHHCMLCIKFLRYYWFNMDKKKLQWVMKLLLLSVWMGNSLAELCLILHWQLIILPNQMKVSTCAEQQTVLEQYQAKIQL